MDNETGLAILSAVLNGMSCPNRILTTEEDISTEIDVRDLQKILLKGCYYDPGLKNGPAIPANETAKELGNANVEDAGKSINVFVETMEGKPLTLTLKPTTTIAELKEMISSTQEIPPNTQRLIFAINLNGDRNVDDQST
ncbi:hypothetical protein DAPPUDRAFT_240450 [Daphnia pulex]|uniref:Ubiquitin-like domain-containing protein n=1 Tax=Daphnia pulex TaxID=6669 RepID=E9GBK6_DAPPU|nr:hypothetical protein DAPPUDRAFT_240450 [Daphnia pulex]|eukprot:EFX82970.1 hypothetical protein DAPPUDRAFT_240450 [Daphnia pulex]